MAGIIAKLVSWLAGKVVVYVVILALLLVIFLVGVLPGMIVKHHERELEQAIEELGKSRELAGELAVKMNSLQGEMDGRMQELRELERQRQAMNKFWDKVKSVFRKAELEAEKRRMEEREQELITKNRETAQAMREVRVEGGESEEEMRRREMLKEDKERQLRDMEGMQTALERLVRSEFWGLAGKAFLILLALILLPFFWKVIGFYVVAPLVQAGRPIVLAGLEEAGEGKVSVVPSRPAQRLTMSEGEVLMTKVDYLQGSMGDFEKRTKWIMDWNYPFSSMAAGMYVLTSIRKLGVERGEVTLSTRDDGMEELAVVEVPAGSELVFRPRFLVALSHPEGMVPMIKSRWVFGKLHAWVSLQFRYLMIEGPVKLVFAAQRGIQEEVVVSEVRGRRVNSSLTVGFSPTMKYSPKRAETFVAYFWGKNGLFDDFFEGDGLVVQQQVTGGKGNPVARAWEGVLGAIGKVFGI